jgi:hypothetical protein
MLALLPHAPDRLCVSPCSNPPPCCSQHARALLALCSQAAKAEPEALTSRRCACCTALLGASLAAFETAKKEKARSSSCSRQDAWPEGDRREANTLACFLKEAAAAADAAGASLGASAGASSGASAGASEAVADSPSHAEAASAGVSSDGGRSGEDDDAPLALLRSHGVVCDSLLSAAAAILADPFFVCGGGPLTTL